MLSAVRFRSPLSIFFAVFVTETVGSYPRGKYARNGFLVDLFCQQWTVIPSDYLKNLKKLTLSYDEALFIFPLGKQSI